MFKLVKNAEQISQFRNLAVKFQIHNGVYDTTSTVSCKINDLHNYIIQKNVEKSKRNLIVVNPFECDSKKKEHAHIPHSFLIDLDFKTEEIKQQFTKDQNVNTFEEALIKVYNNLKNDAATLYLDYSSSGKGIHAIFNIISDYYEQNSHLYIPSDDNSILDKIMLSNFEVIQEYLKPYNIIFRDDKKIDYIDTKMLTVTNSFYSTSGLAYYVNPNAYIIYHNLLNSKLKTKKKVEKISVSIEQNDSFLNKFFEKNDTIGFSDSEVEELKNLVMHYDFRFLASISRCDVEYQKKFYILFKKFYKGDSVRLRTFAGFVKYCNERTVGAKYISPISNILKNINIYEKPEQLSKDFFQNTYNKEIIIDGYITDNDAVTNELFDIFDNNNKVVLKAKAGQGKSTLLFKYIDKCFSENKYKRIVLCSPKNFLLEQQIYLLKDSNYSNIKNVKCVNNFDTNRYDESKYERYNKCLIFSSTPKLSEVADADLIIIDEVQNLVSYSKTIKSNFNKNIKTIAISATPEPYLIYESNYYYVNIKQVNEKKQILNVYLTDSQKKTLRDLIKPDERTLVFINNKSEAQNIIAYLNTLSDDWRNVNWKHINADTADTYEIKTIVTSQQLLSTHYFATSYISDGINLNNKNWDKVVIIESESLMPSEIYQIANRLRLATPSINLISKFRKLSENVFDFDIKEFRNLENYNKLLLEKNKIAEAIEHTSNEELNTNYIMLNRNGSYEFNADTLKKDAYDRYFSIHYSIFHDCFIRSLQYYFDTNVFEKQNIQKPRNASNKLVSQFFADNFQKLVEILKLTDSLKLNANTLSLFDVDFDQNLINYIEKYKTTVNVYFKRILEIEKHNKNAQDYIANIISNNQAWSQFIKNFEKKCIGEKTSIDDVSGFAAKELWSSQEKMIEIAKKCKKSSKKYEYVTSADIAQYILDNDLMSQFRMTDSGAEDRYWLKADKRSVGEFLKNMNRQFIQSKCQEGGLDVRIFKFLKP